MAPLLVKREDDDDNYLSQEEGPFARVVAVAFGADKLVSLLYLQQSMYS